MFLLCISAYFVHVQIWLNHVMDNHHHFSFIKKIEGKKTLHTKMFHPTTDQWSGKRLPMDGVLVGCSFTLDEFF